jgi:hypothetical protein
MISKIRNRYAYFFLSATMVIFGLIARVFLVDTDLGAKI